MKKTIVTTEEIERGAVNILATKVSIVAELANDNQLKKMDMVHKRITEQHDGDIDLENKDDVSLFSNTVMGVLHASAVAEAEFSGTADANGIRNRMGSSFRPDKHCDHDYMFEAVVDPVIVEITRADGTAEPVLRFQLKTDLSTALRDFYEIRKETAEREAAYNLFGAESEG